MPKSRPTVLLLTHHRDFFVIDRVIAELETRGARAIRVDTDRFPAQLSLSTTWDGTRMRYLLDDGEHTVWGQEVSAVWTRSLWPPTVLDQVDEQHREGCRDQSREALEGFLDGLAEARWISPLFQISRSSNKIRQQRLAAEVGLSTPPTLVTNDPDQARAFYLEHQGQVVAKMLHALGRFMGKPKVWVPTSELTEQDLEHLDGLRLAPMIFQKKISKAKELRIKFINDRLFVGAVEGFQTAAGAVDWRQSEAQEVGWLPGSVPAEVEGKLCRLMAALGLIAGAIDLIVTPSGDHVFLEVNPLGEWGMLERDLDLPIASAVADALLSPKPLS